MACSVCNHVVLLDIRALFICTYADNIESNVSSIAVDTSAAAEELSTAHEYQRKAGKRAACLMIVVVIVICIVLLAVSNHSTLSVYCIEIRLSDLLSVSSNDPRFFPDLLMPFLLCFHSFWSFLFFFIVDHKYIRDSSLISLLCSVSSSFLLF